MEPPRPRTVLLLAGVVLYGGILFTTRPSPPPAAGASTERPPPTAAATPSPTPSDPAGDEVANREEIRALFPTPRPARAMPDLSILLASADNWEALIELLGPLSDRQCLQAFEQLQARQAEDRRDTVLRAILVSFAVHNRRVSLARLMSMTDRELARKIWNDSPDFTISVQWSHFKSEETARWLVDQGAKFLAPKEQSEKIAHAVAFWGDSDPRAAAEFAVSLPPEPDTGSPLNQALRDIARRRSTADIPEALAWAEALPGDARRTAALLGVLEWMTNDDPAQAKSYVEQRLGTDKDAAKMAEEVASLLMYEPEETARWAFSLPDRAARRAALHGLVDGWMDGPTNDTQVRAGVTPPAVAWANALSPSDARGAAWGAVAANWSQLQPDNAKVWLLGLPAGEDRNEAITAYDQAILSTARDQLAHGGAEEALDRIWKYPFDRQFAAEQQFGLLATWADQDTLAANRWAVSHGISKPAGTRGR